MKFDIGILRMANDLAVHAAARQAVISENIANADTPGYKARDITSFSDNLVETAPAPKAMRPMRAGHLPINTDMQNYDIFEDAAFGAESPNGNTVSLEDQMVRAAEVRQQHQLALGIYKKSMDILRAGMGRIR